MGRYHLIFTIVVLLSISSHGSADDQRLLYETAIEPILRDKCGKCHSQDVQKGGLNLSNLVGLRRGGDSREPLVAETLDESALWWQIDEGLMPPEGEARLEPNQMETIRQWIVLGGHSNSDHEEAEPSIDQHDVLPIVLLRCVMCHGATVKQGDLDLRTVESIFAGGKHGPAVIPGNADASPLIQRIESEACPPQDLLLKFFVRRPSASEVQTLRGWIDAGTPVLDVQPDVATTQPDPYVTDQEREHWAFQAPQRSATHGGIDAFVGEKLRAVGLNISGEADRDTLIRRVFIDLTGMPPDIQQWRYWRTHAAPDWYARMIDAVLAMPEYGERWGRYWLDVAGYADSEGGVSADPVREVAWKYRDYVIKAFNDDKPYDRFLLEQLAGDELIDLENAAQVTPEMVDNLIATGFLRMGIDQTGSRTMNFVPERLGVISDAIAVVGSGVMGLTMECACHSHKYDPIPHRDYYRLKAVFQGAFDEYDWLTFKNRKLEVGTREHRQLVQDVNPPLIAEVKKLEKELKRIEEQTVVELLKHHEPELSNEAHLETLTARRVADNNRTLRQRTLIEKLQKGEVLPDPQQPQSVLDLRRRADRLRDQIANVQDKMVPPLTIRALWDRGRPAPTYILGRGEHDKPGRLVGPGVPSVLTDGKTPFDVRPPFPEGTVKTGRRLAFARWLTRPDHPLTARVIVNRIWHHHFGVGLVKSLENFGVKGDRPTHRELLDHLALDFIDRGWSIKAMHRQIMNSQTYRQSSRVSDEQRRADPLNQRLSRMPMRRLDAEALRDSLAFVSGTLERSRGGPPDRVAVERTGMVRLLPERSGAWRRSVYAQYRRTEIPTMLDTFDYPEMGPNCSVRNESTVSPQSLMLMHDEQVRQMAAAMAIRVERMNAENDRNGSASEPHADERSANDGWGQYVAHVYALALSREPTSEELSLGIDTLRQMRIAWPDNRRGALEAYCHAILNSAAFIYVD
ncbi:MAG: PSD1 and planctomycete cytochrome C domain-containing protein [Pirellulaceae bacterium]